MRLGSALAQLAFADIRRAFGESVRIQPAIASEYADAAPDPNRPVRTVDVVVAFTPNTDQVDGAKKISTHGSLAMRRGAIWFTPAEYAALGYEVRVGDMATLADRAGAPRYQITSPPVASDRGDIAVNIVLDANP